jgi:hypothetical protein
MRDCELAEDIGLVESDEDTVREFIAEDLDGRLSDISRR